MCISGAGPIICVQYVQCQFRRCEYLFQVLKVKMERSWKLCLRSNDVLDIGSVQGNEKGEAWPFMTPATLFTDLYLAMRPMRRSIQAICFSLFLNGQQNRKHMCISQGVVVANIQNQFNNYLV